MFLFTAILPIEWPFFPMFSHHLCAMSWLPFKRIDMALGSLQGSLSLPFPCDVRGRMPACGVCKHAQKLLPRRLSRRSFQCHENWILSIFITLKIYEVKILILHVRKIEITGFCCMFASNYVVLQNLARCVKSDLKMDTPNCHFKLGK